MSYLATKHHDDYIDDTYYQESKYITEYYIQERISTAVSEHMQYNKNCKRMKLLMLPTLQSSNKLSRYQIDMGLRGMYKNDNMEIFKIVYTHDVLNFMAYYCSYHYIFYKNHCGQIFSIRSDINLTNFTQIEILHNEETDTEYEDEEEYENDDDKDEEEKYDDDEDNDEQVHDEEEDDDEQVHDEEEEEDEEEEDDEEDEEEEDEEEDEEDDDDSDYVYESDYDDDEMEY